MYLRIMAKAHEFVVFSERDLGFMKCAFDNLLSHIQSLVNEDEIQKYSPEIYEHVSAYTSELKRSHDEALKQASKELRKHVSDESNYSGVDNYRGNTGIGPVQLNNIEPPNVLEKIWIAHKEVDGYAGLDITIEQFYGISLNPIYNREMFDHAWWGHSTRSRESSHDNSWRDVRDKGN